MSTPAVAYYRRSTDRQEQSIGDQRKAVEAYGREHGYDLLREYVDDGISGVLTARREAFLRLIDDSASGEFAAVLVYDIGRFGRTDTDEAGHFRYLLRQNGVEVVYTHDNLGTGDEQDLVRGVLQWQKHKFLIDLSRDIARGMVTTAEGGWQAGGKAPYGFSRALVDENGAVVKVLAHGETKMSDRQKVKLVLAEAQEVAVVKGIFRAFLAGWGYRAIAQDLNTRGVPSIRGNGWAGSSIREILVNRHYVGDAVWNKRPKGKFYEVSKGRPMRRGPRLTQRVRRNCPDDWIVVPNAHPSIISRDDFEEVQRRIKAAPRNNGYQARNRRSPYPLSGLVYCNCGNPMWGQVISRPLANGEVRQHRYYTCSGGLSGRCPEHRINVPAEQLERFIVKRLRQVYEESNLHEDVRCILQASRAEEKVDSRDDIEALEREIARIDRAVDNAARRSLMAEDDDIAQGIMREAEALRRRRPVLAAKLEALTAVEEPDDDEVESAVERVLANIRNLEHTYEDASIGLKKEFLRSALVAAEGQPGPVMLNFDRVKAGARAEVTFLGGTFRAVPIAALEVDETLGVKACRRRELNPHTLAGTGF